MNAPLERLLGLARWERAGMRLGLERIEALLDALDRPEAMLRIVHVGGTNGKGSVSALTAAILQAAGLRTGLYTSPHLLDVTERVRIDGVAVSREVLARHAARIERALDTGVATFFEAMTAVALAVFEEARVDAAVLEVGLGGRWDATNVGRALVSVVTRIDYDHQEFLGRRLEDIAGEKAGIIRGGTVLSAAQAPEAMAVIEARCRAVAVPLRVEGRELMVETRASDLEGHRLDLRGPGFAYGNVRLALPGLYQPANAVLAVGAVRAFASASDLPVSEAAVRAGCAAVRWPGRFQVIPGAAGRPTLVLDGAHNPGGATALAVSLRHHFAGRRLALVLGVSADKDRAGILKALAPLAARIYLAPADHPRATPPQELVGQLPPVDAEVVLTQGSDEALARVLGEPGIDVVCVAGSLFLVADALRWLGARGLVAAV
ncbi:MAG TPA: folylpolyglutamate synthase/dihydrofolate synthase family protein [Methylomirabilota bacterium]